LSLHSLIGKVFSALSFCGIGVEWMGEWNESLVDDGGQTGEQDWLSWMRQTPHHAS